MSEADFVPRLDRLTSHTMALPAVTAVHCAGARPRYSDVRTRETELRPRMDQAPFDIVAVVEGVGLMELTRAAADLDRISRDAGLVDTVVQVYYVADVLSHQEGF
jgi:hypothetical protein